MLLTPAACGGVSIADAPTPFSILHHSSGQGHVALEPMLREQMPNIYIYIYIVL